MQNLILFSKRNITNPNFLFIFSALREIKLLKMRIRLEVVTGKASLCHSDISSVAAALDSISIYFLELTSKTKTLSLRLFLKKQSSTNSF